MDFAINDQLIKTLGLILPFRGIDQADGSHDFRHIHYELQRDGQHMEYDFIETDSALIVPQRLRRG